MAAWPGPRRDTGRSSIKPPEDIKRQFVRRWLRRAGQDLAAARHLIDQPDLSTSAAFHAQQAAEKYIKAALVWHQVEFPKTHDMDRLVELMRRADASLGERMREASALTPYGVDVRYPGELPDPSSAEARTALAIAERVRDLVAKHLPSEF